MCKHLTIDCELNEKIKRKVKQRNISSNLFIKEVISFYVENKRNYTNNDNTCTKKINEFTKEVNLIRHKNTSLSQALLSQLDTTLGYQGLANYLQ